MNISVIDLLQGKINHIQLIDAIVSANMDISTPEKRLRLFCQLDWLYWGNQSWNSNFSGISFDEYVEKHSFMLTEGTVYAATWVKTGNTCTVGA